MADKLATDMDSKSVIPWGNNDVKLVASGFVELVISNGRLVVETNIETCNGMVLFCYNSSKTSLDCKTLCPHLSGFCGFQLIGTDNNVTFTKSTRERSELKECSKLIEMKYSSLITKNAKEYIPATSTTSSTSVSKTVSDSTSEAGFPWYIWVLIVFIIITTIAAVIGICVCIFPTTCLPMCKRNPKPPAPVEPVVGTKVEEIKTVTKEEKSKAEKPKSKAEKLPTPAAPKPKDDVPKLKDAKPAVAPTKPKEASKPAKKTPKKEVEKERKKSKTKTPSTETYSPPFCLLPFPAQPFEPEPEKSKMSSTVHPNKKWRGRFADSLELEAERRK
uniref:Uncharacterized protein n=1 Tax=Panagrolaimus superbus TaxID=310955 RepID=A0A914Y2U9_9BILA